MNNDKFWDEVDKAHPELRREAQEFAKTSKLPENVHSRDEIWDYVSYNYADLRQAKNLAIGIQGGIYRVIVTDQFQVNHTLKIDPKEIDRHLAIKARADRLKDRRRTTNKEPDKKGSRAKGREPERE